MEISNEQVERTMASIASLPFVGQLGALIELLAVDYRTVIVHPAVDAWVTKNQHAIGALYGLRGRYDV